MSGRIMSVVVALLMACVAARSLAAAELAADVEKAREQAIAKAIDYLGTKGQAADGSFTGVAGPAVTALVTSAVLHSGRSADDPIVVKALQYIERYVQPDGGIYQRGGKLGNYETCIAITCLAQANKDHRYDSLIEKAERFVKGVQWDEDDGDDKSKVTYGGSGYGKGVRPDLSNTAYLLDALKAAGTSPNDEAMKKALIFVSRCQNLETEHNTTEFAAKNPDGGFYYTPAGGGGSPAGKTPDGGLRSYAAMTYAGLKSMIYAGLTPDDPRVKAAQAWIKAHYSVDENPGMGDSGLYYYYDTFAKALDASQLDTIVDDRGVKHDWRTDLVKALVSRQRPDGSWTNTNGKWMEGDPNLATGFALVALSYCGPKQK